MECVLVGVYHYLRTGHVTAVTIYQENSHMLSFLMTSQSLLEVDRHLTDTT